MAALTKRRPKLRRSSPDYWLWAAHFAYCYNLRSRLKRGKERGRQATQKYRARRLEQGVREYWMIGYDGPSPYPKSAWPTIVDHANVFGFDVTS